MWRTPRWYRAIPNPVVVFIIVFNVLVFLVQHMWLGDDFTFSLRFGAVPLRLTEAWQAFMQEGFVHETWRSAVTLATATFLHADAMHLVSNMFVLWIFGNIVEHLVGKAVFPIVYMLCGILGNVAQVYFKPGSMNPVVGASGAISGLEGLYLLLALRWNPPWPHVWPMARPIPPFNLAIVGIIGFYLDAIGLYNPMENIAFAAHMGGFLGGFGLGLVLTTVYRPKRLYL